MGGVAGKTADVVTAMPAGGGTSHHPPLERLTALEDLALAAVVILGAALRLWQYAADSSLWIDEIALAKGILALDPWSLITGPLPYNQVSPVGFLLVQKLAVTALGPGDYALRLFPLACSLMSLVVFSRLARQALEGAGPLAAVILFATAAPFIAYGALVKQYSTDVCVAVLLWWLAHDIVALASEPTGGHPLDGAVGLDARRRGRAAVPVH